MVTFLMKVLETLQPSHYTELERYLKSKNIQSESELQAHIKSYEHRQRSGYFS